MGSITKAFETENDITVFTILGEVDADQLQSQIISFLTGNPTRLVLWNIREGNLAGISSGELKMIVERAKPFSDKRSGGRTAIVCSKDVDYGLSRMFQTFAELLQVPIEFKVFRELDAAREWLSLARNV